MINCLRLPGTEGGAVHDAGFWELRNGNVLGKPGQAGQRTLSQPLVSDSVFERSHSALLSLRAMTLSESAVV